MISVTELAEEVDVPEISVISFVGLYASLTSDWSVVGVDAMVPDVVAEELRELCWRLLS